MPDGRGKQTEPPRRENVSRRADKQEERGQGKEVADTMAQKGILITDNRTPR